MLHRERLEGRAKRLHALPATIDRLPDGTMIEAAGQSYLIRQARALLWSWSGYRAARLPPGGAMLLTPPSTVNALRAGYRALLHPSAAQA